MLITQAAPFVSLIDNLPDIPVEVAVMVTPATPLVEILNHPEEFATLAVVAPKPVAAKLKTAASVPAVYSRLLDRVTASAGVVDAPPSHSLRRGGAQHVNDCHG